MRNKERCFLCDFLVTNGYGVIFRDYEFKEVKRRFRRDKVVAYVDTVDHLLKPLYDEERKGLMVYRNYEFSKGRMPWWLI